MSYTQPSLFGDDQPDLFGGRKGEPVRHVPKPQHVRNRFIDFMAQLSAAETWPWDESQRELYCGRVWPYLYPLLPDPEEAATGSASLRRRSPGLTARR